jgi:glycosyltransferase involved in cell wall biosynthesis
MTRLDGQKAQVWVTSKVGPTYQGGLAAYQRLVIRSLEQQNNCSLMAFCVTVRSDFLPAAEETFESPITHLEKSQLGKISEPLWNRLASRSVAHPLLEFALRRSWQAPAATEPTVIHYTGTGWDFVGFAIAEIAHKCGAHFVITPAIHPFSWGDDNIDLRLYHRADRVICFTDREKQHLAELGLPQHKLFVCPLPPMCRSSGDGFGFRNRHRLAERLCVLFLGRRDEGKGYPALLQAWPRVLQSFPDAVLILAGAGGAKYQELKGKIPAQNLCDVGIPDEIEKANAIAACDIFCLPSAHESFGIVYVDAWSYGKPVICGTAPACREFICDGRTGLWANQVPEELAERLVAVLENRDLRERLGQAGRLEQVRRFNFDVFLRTHFCALGLAADPFQSRTSGKTPEAC